MLIILYNGVDIDLKPYFLKADVLRALLYDRVGGKKAHLVKKMSEFIGNLPSDQKEIYKVFMSRHKTSMQSIAIN